MTSSLIIEKSRIEKALNERGIQATFFQRRKTTFLNLYRFFITEGGNPEPKEYLRIWTSNHHANKVHIETRYGAEYLNDSTLEELEQCIEDSIKTSPKNKIPHLLNPIKFIGCRSLKSNLPPLDIEESAREKLTRNINKVETISCKSYYALQMPTKSCDSNLLDTFNSLDSTQDISREKDVTTIYFFKMNKRMMDDKKALYVTKSSLKKYGIEAEIIPSIDISSSAQPEIVVS